MPTHDYVNLLANQGDFFLNKIYNNEYLLSTFMSSYGRAINIWLSESKEFIREVNPDLVRQLEKNYLTENSAESTAAIIVGTLSILTAIQMAS
jgi:hypothetical protein